MRTRLYTIECDECGYDINEPFANVAEEQARAEGWRLGKRDVCPNCVDGLSREEVRYGHYG